MSKINVQFHATPAETIRFIKECAKEYSLHIVLVELYPSFAASLLNEADGALENISIYNTNRVCLYIEKPETISNSYLDFLDKNSDYLSITIGKHLDNQLEESVLATQTENVEGLKTWKKIVKKFNTVTLSGAWLLILTMEQKYFINNTVIPREQRNFLWME
jgi:hypothetical protein